MEHRDGVEVLQVESGAAESLREKVSQETETEAADSQLPLPQGLQDLLRRLAGCLSPGEEPVESLPWLKDKTYGDFFRSEGRECHRRTEVRLMVLEALGTCNSLKKFDSEEVKYWHLSVKEWEALLIHFQATAQLEVIVISSLESAEEEALIGPLLKKLISGSLNLRKLTLALDVRSRAKFFAEVASAFRPKQHHELKELHFFMPDAEGSVMLSVAEIISCAPYLETLHINYPHRLDGDAKEALSRALKGSARLKVFFVDEELTDVLVEVYSATCSHPVLERLQLWENWEGITAQALASLIGGNITSISISLQRDVVWASPSRLDEWKSSRTFTRFSLDEWKSIGRSLLHPPTLRQFQIHFYIDNYSKQMLEAMRNGYTEMWNASQRSSLLHLPLTTDYSSFLYTDGCKIPFFLETTWLKEVIIRGVYVNNQDFTSIVDKLASNSSVESLKMLQCYNSSSSYNISKDGWGNLFSHLRRNTSIRNLEIRHSSGLNDENFRDMMDLLQVNFILEKIDVWDTNWGADGKSVLIEEALRRNKKHAGYFSILADAKLTFDGAKAGRVFLCGEPFAGKTTLKRTMMSTMSKKSNSESIIRKKGRKLISRLRRTKGIEVELLCEEEFGTISIWDLAGQEVFRALQNILFPRMSQACIFIFAFNPFQGHGKKGMLKHKVDESFHDELMSWLRFIASNIFTGRILPQVLVVITHKDCDKSQEKLDTTVFMDIVKALQARFQDVLELCPKIDVTIDKSDLLYHIDGTVEKEVQPITDVVLHCMKNLLREKSPRVPKACADLASKVMKLPKEVKSSPLWLTEQFYGFCSSNHIDLNQFKCTDNAGRSVLHAVASYMHDIGAICMMPSAILPHEEATREKGLEKLIVVQLNWLSQNLLGELIITGQDWVQQSLKCAGIDGSGFISSQDLFALINNVQQKNPHISVDHKMVKELLVELDLCHKLEQGSVIKYFMPIILNPAKVDVASEETSKMIDITKWREENAAVYFGFRVQCRDQDRTSLNAAFYPRYQIHLRKQMENQGVADDSFTFACYRMKISSNGCIIIVEMDQYAQSHIDIMVKFSKEKIRDSAMHFVQESVVKDLIQFCASGRGCPGVQLVVSILRPECVRQLTPCKLRTKNQVVLIEDLKKRFQMDVESQLGGTSTNAEESFLDYQHTWPKIESADAQFNLDEEFQLATTLLTSKDVNDVLTCVQVLKDHRDLQENLIELRQFSNRLNDGSVKCELAIHCPAVRAQYHLSSEESSVQRESKLESSRLLMSTSSLETRHDIPLSAESKYLRDEIHHSEERLTTKFQRLEQRIDAGFQQVRDDLKKFKSILNEMGRQMSHVTSTVDDIIGYMSSKDGHRTPSRPYFTEDDVTLMQKVKAKMFFGKAVRLHLMCEVRHRSPHFVENQEGLEVRSEKEDEFSKAMRKLSMISLYMIWVLLKIGAQVTANLGSVVPDISNLATGSCVVVSASTDVVLDCLKVELDKDPSLLKADRSTEEAWFCLRDHLDKNLTRADYAHLFKLHLVRYRNYSNDPFAWLCEKCVKSGTRNLLLEK